MNYRQLGSTGRNVSVLGFGCGAVGGLLVKGNYSEMVRTVARAIEAGVNYFDTAPLYGDGRSEQNLGQVLAELDADVIVGTKVQLQSHELDDIESAVIRSVEASLARLGREQVDLIQLHNFVDTARNPDRRWVTVDDVAAAVTAFERLQRAGKVRFWGFNGLGDVEAVRQVLATRVQTMQSVYNLLNPSAGLVMPDGFPFQDYGCVLDAAGANQVGVIAIRVLAGGALSGSTTRHANAAQTVTPIATGDDMAEDVTRAQRLNFLVEAGMAGSLAEAAIRFAIGQPRVSTALVGISTLAQLEKAVAAAEAGPLPAEALERLSALWSS